MRPQSSRQLCSWNYKVKFPFSWQVILHSSLNIPKLKQVTLVQRFCPIGIIQMHTNLHSITKYCTWRDILVISSRPVLSPERQVAVPSKILTSSQTPVGPSWTRPDEPERIRPSRLTASVTLTSTTWTTSKQTTDRVQRWRQADETNERKVKYGKSPT